MRLIAFKSKFGRYNVVKKKKKSLKSVCAPLYVSPYLTKCFALYSFIADQDYRKKHFFLNWCWMKLSLCSHEGNLILLFCSWRTCSFPSEAWSKWGSYFLNPNGFIFVGPEECKYWHLTEAKEDLQSFSVALHSKFGNSFAIFFNEDKWSV